MARVPSFVVLVWYSKHVLLSDGSFYTITWTFLCLSSTSHQCRNFLGKWFGWLILRVHLTHTAQPLGLYQPPHSLTFEVIKAPQFHQLYLWLPEVYCEHRLVCVHFCVWTIVKSCKCLFISLCSSLKFLLPNYCDWWWFIPTFLYYAVHIEKKCIKY